jgi:hypothetical protein
MSWLLLLLVLLQGVIVPALPSDPATGSSTEDPSTLSADRSTLDDGVIGDQDY